jgi:hypothetical protein
MAADGTLKTRLWLDGCLRQVALTGQSYYIAHRGDDASGTVGLKLTLPTRQGCRVLLQGRDDTGALTWLPALQGAIVPEADADAYLARLADRDPDIWIVEIETRDGLLPAGFAALPFGRNGPL